MASLTKGGYLEMLAAYAAVALDEPEVKLTKDSFLPSLSISAADLDAIQADFPGYAAVALGAFPADWSAVQWSEELGAARVVSTMPCVFTRNAGGDPQSVYGWYLVSSGDGSVVACGVFPEPAAMDNNGDVLALIPSVSVPVQGEWPYQEN